MTKFQNNENEKEKCEFFGTMGILHQLLLGILTFSLLIIKRYLEKPRRPWIIWFYDVIKQIISSFVLYAINIAFSYILSEERENSDVFAIYFMNLLLGCIGGYYITSQNLMLFEYAKKKYKLKITINEVYYDEIINSDNTKSYKLKTKIYIYEIIMWTFLQLIWKFILLIMFNNFKLLFILFGKLCLKPFTNAHLKSFMILCVFPFFLNGFYYWSLDNLLKVKKKTVDIIVKNVEEE
jgi:hypothetical protein